MTVAARRRDALTAAVARAPRQRRPWSAELDRGPLVVTGDPRGWAAAAEDVARAGGQVVAFHDARRRPRRLMFGRRPVVSGPALGPLGRLPLLYAGEPKKFWFNRGTRPIGRCLWHTPPSGWRASGRATPDLLDEHADALAEVHALLHDATSKAIYASLIRGRVDGSSDHFRVSPYREYDHPIVRARPGDRVVDAGAYDGDSARDFAWRMWGRGRILALEPSPENFTKLTRRRVPGLDPVRVGAWHRDDILELDEQGGSSRVRDGGGTRIPVAPIDALVAERGLDRVDLIKLDVEGAERQALEGARQTIRRHRPKLQVSIYHLRADLFELPLLLRSWLDGYRFYLGHHSYYHVETDLYAVPEERVRE